MSPKQKLITVAWCAATMACTMMLSHGHLIMKEILRHWPTSDSWESRFETALYTQGGLVLLASVLLSVSMSLRTYFVKQQDERMARRDRIQRDQHERAAERRHEALLDRLSETGRMQLGGGSNAKKSVASGVKVR